MESERKLCALCGKETDSDGIASEFAVAGAWLAEEVWQDSGELCSRCLENRGMLAMMYLHDRNR